MRGLARIFHDWVGRAVLCAPHTGPHGAARSGLRALPSDSLSGFGAHHETSRLYPKSEIRNPKAVRRLGAESGSAFGLRPSFGLRASGFGTNSADGSVLIIVLWIAFGLVTLALYFANSMNLELRASDNRVSAQGAEQAIEGAARYINYILTTQISNGSNGSIPGTDVYLQEAVPVGDAHFWIIGRETNNVSMATQLCFGLIDEASKLNLNTACSNNIYWLPRMTSDLLEAMMDWRDTNGNGPTATYYAMQQPAYVCKAFPFESVDELRLVEGADMDILVGEDANRNGILDPNENDDNQNGQVDPGIFGVLHGL